MKACNFLKLISKKVTLRFYSCFSNFIFQFYLEKTISLIMPKIIEFCQKEHKEFYTTRNAAPDQVGCPRSMCSAWAGKSY
jgi:hypothetical protein